MKLLLFIVLSAPFAAFGDPINLGTRLELFADTFLIEEEKGALSRHVHQPEPKEVVLIADEKWEGNTSGYFGVFQDGPLYRMIYRGWQHDPTNIAKAIHPHVTCLAVSEDGITWRKPNLGIKEFDGSKANNIIQTGLGTHNFTGFLDQNRKATADAKYKALAWGRGGLIYFKSPDCERWSIAREKPVITRGAFDSQNLAFWDEERKEYRAYWRIFSKGVRAIRTATSSDFVHWKSHADLTYPAGTPTEHLYTNAIQPYPRAPHLFIGFPTRYFPKEKSRTEPVFMMSRDGVRFTRHGEPVIPESAPKDRRGNRSNYMAWGMLSLPDRPHELSVYAAEAYYGRGPVRIRRFTYRVDGFVSLRAGEAGGEIVTKPITFKGATLSLNCAVKDGGSLTVELLDESNDALPGYVSVAPLTGDSVQVPILWKNGRDLGSLTGKPVRLRFILKNADLYAMRFH